MRFIKERLLILFWGILFVLLCFVCYFKFGRVYQISLPVVDDLVSITLKKDSESVIINDKNEMNLVLNLLKNRTTTTRSIQDFPVNRVDFVSVYFNFFKGGSSVLFLYEEEDKYYVEQPYNGIYEIFLEDYNLFKNMF